MFDLEYYNNITDFGNPQNPKTPFTLSLKREKINTIEVKLLDYDAFPLDRSK